MRGEGVGAYNCMLEGRSTGRRDLILSSDSVGAASEPDSRPFPPPPPPLGMAGVRTAWMPLAEITLSGGRAPGWTGAASSLRVWG